MKEKVSNRKLTLWGIGNLGEGIIAMVSSTYLSIFLTDVAVLPLVLVSFVSIFSSVFDFFMVPFAGGILVKSKPKRWGRFRSWLIITPPLTVIFFILAFTVVPGKYVLTSIFVLVGYVVAKGSWNIGYAANSSLTAVMSTTHEMKSNLTGQRMMGSHAGRMLGNYLTPLIVIWFATRFGESSGYQFAILITGLIYIITNLIHFYISKDYDNAETNKTKTNADGTTTMSVKEIALVLIKNPQLLITLLIDLTSNIYGLALPSLAVYYYKYVAQSPAMTATHMLTIGLGGLLGATIVRNLGRKINDPKKFLLGLYVLVPIGLLSLRFVASQPWLFLAGNGLISIMTGMTQPQELCLYIDNTIYYRHKTGKDAVGFIMGLTNLPVKFASVIKATLIPLTLIAVGYVANSEPTPEMQNAIVNAYTLFPTFFPVLGFILLKFFYKLKREDIDRMKEEIDAQDAQRNAEQNVTE